MNLKFIFKENFFLVGLSYPFRILDLRQFRKQKQIFENFFGVDFLGRPTTAMFNIAVGAGGRKAPDRWGPPPGRPNQWFGRTVASAAPAYFWQAAESRCSRSAADRWSVFSYKKRAGAGVSLTPSPSFSLPSSPKFSCSLCCLASPKFRGRSPLSFLS